MRNLDTVKAQALGSLPGVVAVKVDIDDLASLVHAYTGADAVRLTRTAALHILTYIQVFACTVPGPNELAQGKLMADASLQTGIALHIWSTLESVNGRSGGKLVSKQWDDKAEVDAYILQKGIPAVRLVLGAFFESKSRE